MLELYRGRQALDELPKEDLPCRFLLAYAANFAKEGNYRVALSMLRSGKLADEFKNPEEYDAFAGIYEKARRPETLLTLKFAPDVYTGLAEAFFKIKDYGSCEKICSFKKQFYAEKVSPRDKELAAACQKERPPSDPEPSL
ncbi:MAG: hypothetical protein COT17_07890 [Elusimicrobia bacterium CG08_land_8_20_14_0_20_51_18]|nr:MAG: hypothetical protein COT17_07890 [Elusimicrobia bacterium CG08_land_8_20_14_0_20_51_18]